MTSPPLLVHLAKSFVPIHWMQPHKKKVYFLSQSRLNGGAFHLIQGISYQTMEGTFKFINAKRGSRELHPPDFRCILGPSSHCLVALQGH